jgi:tetratricopeptide (TPR) repeat protein
MPQRPWLGLVCLQLAVWSRMDGVVFAVPLVLLRRRLWPLTAGLSALNVAAFAYSVGRYAPAEIGWRHPAILDYWLAQPAVLVRYLSLMIWPSGQTVDHDLAPLSFVRSGAALIVLAALGAAAWLCRKKWPVPAAGLGWLFLSLTPAALVPNSDLLNESRAYPALAGAAAAAAWFLGRAGRGDFSERGRVVLALGIAVTLGWLSVSRNRLWNDDLGLWREAAQVSPGKARPHYNFAVALARQGRLDESETEFKAANRLQPDDDLSYAALGYCAEMRKDWRNAHSYYLQALRINPGNRYASEGAVRTSKGAAEGGELEADAPMDRRGPVEKRR